MYEYVYTVRCIYKNYADMLFPRGCIIQGSYWALAQAMSGGIVL